MKTSHKVLVAVLTAVVVLELCVICVLLRFFIRERPFYTSGFLDVSLEKFTYSTTRDLDYEVQLSRDDAITVREYLLELSLISKAPFDETKKQGMGDILYFYTDDGEKHALKFYPSETILGFEVGIIGIDGQQYYVDYWESRYCRRMCMRYREEYIRSK